MLWAAAAYAMVRQTETALAGGLAGIPAASLVLAVFLALIGGTASTFQRFASSDPPARSAAIEIGSVITASIVAGLSAFFFCEWRGWPAPLTALAITLASLGRQTRTGSGGRCRASSNPGGKAMTEITSRIATVVAGLIAVVLAIACTVQFFELRSVRSDYASAQQKAQADDQSIGTLRSQAHDVAVGSRAGGLGRASVLGLGGASRV